MPRPPFNNGTWSCALCGTFTTPVRRSGSAGSKALCNACGLRRSKTARLPRFPSSISAPPGAAATKPRRGRPRTRTSLSSSPAPPRPPPILVPSPPSLPRPALSPLSSASSSFRRPPPPTPLSPPHTAPSFGDIVDAMSTVSRPVSSAAAVVVARPAADARPVVSDTSAVVDEGYGAADGDAEAMRRNLEALHRLMHDGGGGDGGVCGGRSHRRWVV